MRIAIAATIPAETLGRALTLARRAERYGADYVEVRLDSLYKIDGLEKIANSTDLPLIATNRKRSEGGRFKGTEKERIETLIEAARKGFDYIDIELSTKNVETIAREIRKAGSRTIISFHDLDGTPPEPELDNILEREIDAGAHICKLVCRAAKIEDNCSLLSFISKARRRARIVCFGMGRLGAPSRILSPLYGSAFTFASIEKGLETAKGQLTISELRKIYNLMGFG
jgi:3-dehydroquinate dehydratase type I